MTTADTTRADPFTYGSLDDYLGLCYSRRIGTHLVERQRNGSIRIKDYSGRTLLTYEPHAHDFRLHASYRFRGAEKASTALMCPCGAWRAA